MLPSQLTDPSLFHIRSHSDSQSSQASEDDSGVHGWDAKHADSAQWEDEEKMSGGSRPGGGAAAAGAVHHHVSGDSGTCKLACKRLSGPTLLAFASHASSPATPSSALAQQVCGSSGLVGDGGQCGGQMGYKRPLLCAWEWVHVRRHLPLLCAAECVLV